MDAAAGQRVEENGQGCDQRLAFAGLHLGDVAGVKDEAAEELDVVMALAEGPFGALADGRKGLLEQVVEAFPVLATLAQGRRSCFEFVVGKPRGLFLERVDRLDTAP